MVVIEMQGLEMYVGLNDSDECRRVLLGFSAKACVHYSCTNRLVLVWLFSNI